MRLLCVIDNLASGGAQRQLVTLGIGLRRAGHGVTFFVYHPQDFFASTLTEAGIPVRQALKTSRWSVGPLTALRQELTAGGHDVVLSFLDTPNIYAELARTGLRGPRLVVSERSSFGPGGPGLTSRARLQLHRLADFITTNSHHQRETLERLCPWTRARIRTIWNGVDLDRFRPPVSRPVGSTLELLVVSSIAPFKNGLTLVRALRRLRDEANLRPRVTWVGEHQMQIPMRRAASEAMRQEIARFGLEAQWRWLEPTPDVPALMQQHHALVHPSYLEGLPNAICEALASGLPVIASNVLDHPRLVDNGTTGFLFDPFDDAALAAAIGRFAQLRAEERRQMSLAARSDAELMLSMPRFIGAYEQLFQDVLAGAVDDPLGAEAHRV